MAERLPTMESVTRGVLIRRHLELHNRFQLETLGFAGRNRESDSALFFAPISCMPQWLPHSLPIGSERVRGNRRVDCVPRVLQNRAQGPLARIITFRTPPLVHPSLPRKPSRNVRVPTDGYHLSGCTWGNGPAGPRKVARRTRNIKHDRRGERQMPDPGRQHRGREAFQPQPNEHRS